MFEAVPGFEPEDLVFLRNYFQRTGDRGSLIWSLSPVKPSDFLRGNMDVAHGKERYRIIDGFGGRQPILLNYDFLVAGMNVVPFMPTILLDSNVVSYLHNYVTGGIASRTNRRGFATRSLLTRFVQLGWDYNPAFYYMETLTKNIFEKTSSHALGFAETMLKLHTMDEAHFLKSGDVQPNEERVAAYLKDDNVETLSQLAERHIRDTATDIVPHVPINLLQATYACLLKAGILNCTKMSKQRKMEQFFEFLHNDLGCLMLRETLIAGLHFRSKAGNLIPINPNYKKDFRTKMMASSWDVMLLRMPELLLAQGGQQQGAVLAYVCTADGALQELGAMFTLFRLMSLKENNFQEVPQMIFHKEVIERLLGLEIANVFFQVYGTDGMVEQVRTPADHHKIAKTVLALEHEASRMVGVEAKR